MIVQNAVSVSLVVPESLKNQTCCVYICMYVCIYVTVWIYVLPVFLI